MVAVGVLDHPVTLDASLIAESEAEIERQVAEYAAGDRRTFELTVSTPMSFTGRVMRALLDIPYGETRTYGEVAADLDTAARAVGQGCARNPVPIVVPCHRVVGATSTGGYQYPGLKEELLRLEAPGSGAGATAGRT